MLALAVAQRRWVGVRQPGGTGARAAGRLRSAGWARWQGSGGCAAGQERGSTGAMQGCCHKAGAHRALSRPRLWGRPTQRDRTPPCQRTCARRACAGTGTCLRRPGSGWAGAARRMVSSGLVSSAARRAALVPARVQSLHPPGPHTQRPALQVSCGLQRAPPHSTAPPAPPPAVARPPIRVRPEVARPSSGLQCGGSSGVDSLEEQASQAEPGASESRAGGAAPSGGCGGAGGSGGGGVRAWPGRGQPGRGPPGWRPPKAFCEAAGARCACGSLQAAESGGRRTADEPSAGGGGGGGSGGYCGLRRWRRRALHGN